MNEMVGSEAGTWYGEIHDLRVNLEGGDNGPFPLFMRSNLAVVGGSFVILPLLNQPRNLFGGVAPGSLARAF